MNFEKKMDEIKLNCQSSKLKRKQESKAEQWSRKKKLNKKLNKKK